MFELSNRPFQEIRFKNEELDASQHDEIANWLYDNSQYTHNTEVDEYILSMPHPTHPSFGGKSFEDFTVDCPPLLKDILSEIYETRLKQMTDEKWTSEFDLEHDFGFVLVVIL